MLLLFLGCVLPEPTVQEGDITTTPASVCPEPERLVDSGDACIIPDDGGWSVQLAQVEGGGCVEAWDWTCSVEVQGWDIVVHGGITAQAGCSDEVCPLDAWVALQSCDLPDLADGRYTLVYGDGEAIFEWPLVDDACVRQGVPAYH